MPDIYTWSDLTAFWRCPRAWAYQRMGWQPLLLPDPVVTGTLIHAGITAHYREQSPRRTLEDAMPEASSASEQWLRLMPIALALVDRYMDKYGESISVDRADTLISHQFGSLDDKLIGGHPDLLGWAHGKRVLIELKTGASPDISLLDMTGQRDFYAFLSVAAGLGSVALVYLDIISPEYITRVERPPRIESAQYSLQQLLELQGWTLKEALAAPRFAWDCNRCWFFHACVAREQGGSDRAVLEARYLQKEPRQ